MNVSQINAGLLSGDVDRKGIFPHIDGLSRAPLVFEIDFGLRELPEQPGVLLIRGARQYGKSTWLEQELRKTIQQFGPGTALYLNGDELVDVQELVEAIRNLVPLYRGDAAMRRLFIDEITAIKDWERGLKRLLDAGELREVLVVTTGSRATDLRRGVERLPGRKGRLSRTSYLFTPISFAEFDRVCGERLGEDRLVAYLLSGGCPLAAAELATHGSIPEYVIEMVRDWVLGECAASGRDRGSLLAVWEVVLRRGCTAVGQAAVARDAGLANNTVAAGYLELLADLLCLGRAYAWDAGLRTAVRRKPAKLPPINLLAAVAFDTARLRDVAAFRSLAPDVQGRWLEWLVAQEIARRAALRGDDSPETLLYWEGGGHEADYVVRPDLLIEVRRGSPSPLDFAWFPRTFPRASLWIAGASSFETGRIRGLPIEALLLDDMW